MAGVSAFQRLIGREVVGDSLSRYRVILFSRSESEAEFSADLSVGFFLFCINPTNPIRPLLMLQTTGRLISLRLASLSVLFRFHYRYERFFFVPLTMTGGFLCYPFF